MLFTLPLEANRVLLDQRVHEDRKDQRVLKDNRGQRVHEDRKVLKDSRDQRVHEDHKACYLMEELLDPFPSGMDKAGWCLVQV